MTTLQPMPNKILPEKSSGDDCVGGNEPQEFTDCQIFILMM
jgi:hypothetical protein